MSTDPTNLLRMLEPAVRPDGRSARVSGAAQQGAETAPFERQSFDQLLQQARGTDANVEAQATAKQADAAGPLAMLSGLTRVENASLRHQLEARLTAPPADHTHNNLSHESSD